MTPLASDYFDVVVIGHQPKDSGTKSRRSLVLTLMERLSTPGLSESEQHLRKEVAEELQLHLLWNSLSTGLEAESRNDFGMMKRYPRSAAPKGPFSVLQTQAVKPTVSQMTQMKMETVEEGVKKSHQCPFLLLSGPPRPINQSTLNCRPACMNIQEQKGRLRQRAAVGQSAGGRASVSPPFRPRSARRGICNAVDTTESD